MDKSNYNLEEMSSSLTEMVSRIGEVEEGVKQINSKIMDACEDNTAPAVQKICNEMTDTINAVVFLFKEMTEEMKGFVKSTEAIHVANGGNI